MVTLIEGTDCVQAWRKGVNELLSKGDLFNMITTIQDPCSVDRSWYHKFSPGQLESGAPSLSEVEATIFPEKIREKTSDRQELYSRYLEVHKRAKSMHPRTGHRWGTYFERLISFGNSNTNQLDGAIRAMQGWGNNHKAAIVLHLSSPEIDSVSKTLGHPCMQYLEVTCPSKTQLDLVAVYRNHDFFERALGNFLGLGRLLLYIAQETDRVPRQLVCHSVHAYISRQKRLLKSVIQSNV